LSATNLYDRLVIFIQGERASAPPRVVTLNFFQPEFLRKNKKTKIMIAAIMIIRTGLIAKLTINPLHQQSSIIDPKGTIAEVGTAQLVLVALFTPESTRLLSDRANKI
jgi:hypothetical protein